MEKLLLKRLINILLLLLVLFTAQPAESIGLSQLKSAVDWSCINFKIVGLCFKSTPPYVGLKIRYWEPALLIETVKNPGDSVVEGMGTVVSSLTKQASKSLLNGITGLNLSVSSGSSSSSLSHTNMQFNEVHVYSFPFIDVFASLLSMECSTVVPPIGFVNYLSELDSLEWRVGIFETLSPKSMLSASLGPICSGINKYSGGLCMGLWGPVYPRRGFITHQSEVVGSAADAYRAVSIAGTKGFSSHIVPSPLLFTPSQSKDKLQLIYPTSSGCINIGENPLFWESGKTSINGKYVWVYWRHRDCCIY